MRRRSLTIRSYVLALCLSTTAVFGQAVAPTNSPPWDIAKKLSLQTYIQHSYHSDPAPGRLKNDVKLVAALAYKI